MINFVKKLFSQGKKEHHQFNVGDVVYLAGYKWIVIKFVRHHGSEIQNMDLFGLNHNAKTSTDNTNCLIKPIITLPATL